MHFFQVKNVGVWVMVNLIREKLSAYGIVHFHKTKVDNNNSDNTYTARVPNGISYQAVARIAQGQPTQRCRRTSEIHIAHRFTNRRSGIFGSAKAGAIENAGLPVYAAKPIIKRSNPPKTIKHTKNEQKTKGFDRFRQHCAVCTFSSGMNH
jgi:hypothetical protein